MKKIKARFYRSDAGKEPVREWLQAQDKADRRAIGEDIKTAEYGWPIGMPVVRKMAERLWEIRTDLSSKRIARVFFTVVGQVDMVLLHGIIKKDQKTPLNDLRTAKRRAKKVHDNE